MGQENREDGYIKKFFKGGVGATGYFVFKLYIIPIGLPLMTGIVAWAQGIQWAYLIALVVFVTAMVFHGLVKFDEWQIRTRVEDKIVFSDILFAKDIGRMVCLLGFWLIV